MFAAEIADPFSNLWPLQVHCYSPKNILPAACKALPLSCPCRRTARSQYLLVGRLWVTTEAAAAGDISATQQALEACSNGLANTQPCINYTHTHTLSKITTVGAFYGACSPCPRIGIVPMDFIITWLSWEIPRASFRWPNWIPQVLGAQRRVEGDCLAVMKDHKVQ